MYEKRDKSRAIVVVAVNPFLFLKIDFRPINQFQINASHGARDCPQISSNQSFKVRLIIVFHVSHYRREREGARVKYEEKYSFDVKIYNSERTII